MDVVYIFRHSKHQDEEIRYSLRSVSKHLTWVRKIWIFGDRPEWLSSDLQVIENVPHDSIAWIEGFKTPVTNTFIMLYLIALLPDVDSEFLIFSDDFILLRELTPDDARTPRYLQDMDASAGKRGTGLFKEALWRTYDVLRRLKLPRLNYEVHVPVRLTKRRILTAVRVYRDYMTEDRFFGPLAKTAIFNHAQPLEGFTPQKLSDEGKYAGFHRDSAKYDEILDNTRGKLFLNFDDSAYSSDMRRFLQEVYPEPCQYESCYVPPASLPTGPDVDGKSSALSAATGSKDSTPDTLVYKPDSPLGIPARNENAASDPSCCVVLVPYRGEISKACETGLRELERRGYVVRRVSGYSAIDRARCQLASDAISDGYKETMWIDSDIGFNADDVEILRQRGLPLCCGIYPKKGQRSMTMQALPGTKEIMFGKKGGLSELLYSGAGFLHVRSYVYQRIQQQLNLPECTTEGKRQLIPFFMPVVHDHDSSHRYLSDDFAFCHRARQCGIPIIADTTIRLFHIGETDYSWEEAGSSKARFDSYRFQLSNSNKSPNVDSRGYNTTKNS